MINCSLNPEDAASVVATIFGDIDRVLALEGDLIAHDSLSRVLRVSAGGRRYYVKRYSGTDQALQRHRSCAFLRVASRRRLPRRPCP